MDSPKRTFEITPVGQPKLAFTLGKGQRRRLVGREQKFHLTPTSDAQSENLVLVDYERALLQSPQFISVAEASDSFSLPPYRVRKLCREKKIKGYKRGRNWVISVDSLQKYLKKN